MAHDSYICPRDIVGLKELFLPPKADDTGENEEPSWGFRRGSSLLVSGPPGSGKTTFSLAILRSLMRYPRSKNKPRSLAYYISVEVDRDRLKRMYQDRGWFSDRDEIFSDTNDDKHEGLHVVKTPMEIERPVRSTEELLNHITAEIARRPVPEEGQDVFLIVDSITSLLKDSSGPGEERRQTFELLHRLKALFPDQGSGKNPLALMFLLSEHAGSVMSDPKSQTYQANPKPKVEDYVANYVVHLDTNTHSLGHRTRVLEFTKSQGSHMMLGQHTWLILTHDESDKNTSFPEPYSRRIVGKSIRRDIRTAINRIESSYIATQKYSHENYVKYFIGKHCMLDGKDNIEKIKRRLENFEKDIADCITEHNKKAKKENLELFFTKVLFCTYKNLIDIEDFSISKVTIAEHYKKIFKVNKLPFDTNDIRDHINTFIENLRVDINSKDKTPFYTSGTIVISRRSYVAAGEYIERDKTNEANRQNSYKKVSNPEYIWTGVPGLDQMLHADTKERKQYWVAGKGEKRLVNEDIKQADIYSALEPGDVSVIIGEPGSGKSSMCLPFLFADTRERIIEVSQPSEGHQTLEYSKAYEAREKLKLLKKFTRESGKSKEVQDWLKKYFYLDDEAALFISFENDPKKHAKKFLSRLIEDSGINPAVLDVDQILENAEFIFRPRNALDFNLLLQEAHSWLTHNKSKKRRIVIDGVSDLLSSHERLAVTQMLDSLLALFQAFDNNLHNDPPKGMRQEYCSTILVTYEEKVIDASNESDSYRIPAHNLITLKKLNIRDESRYAVQVMKSARSKNDRFVREVILDKKECSRIVSGFDGYTGLTSKAKSAEPAEVLLEFFEENRLESLFNLFLTKKLKTYYPYNFKTRNITKENLQFIDSDYQNLPEPKSDLYIKSVDEWAADDNRSEAMGIFGIIEKDSKRIFKEGYCDYGMLGCHSEILQEIPDLNLGIYGKTEEPLIPHEFLDDIKKETIQEKSLIRLPVNPKLRHQLRSFQRWFWFCSNQSIRRKSYKTLLNSWHKELDDTRKRSISITDCKSFLQALVSTEVNRFSDDGSKPERVAFSFDLETPANASSFFLELIMAMGAKNSESALIKKNPSAVKCALAFLGTLSAEGLIAMDSSTNKAIYSAFSRQYYSEFQQTNLEKVYDPKEAKDINKYILIPSMPRSPFGDQISYSCNGTWHLGFLLDSPDAGIGRDIITTLCSSEMEYQRAAWGAGIPPAGSGFYKYYGNYSVSGAGYWNWSDIQMEKGKKNKSGPLTKQLVSRKQLTQISSAQIQMPPLSDIFDIIQNAMCAIIHECNYKNYTTDDIASKVEKVAENLRSNLA
ncbi:MAG: ATPase domain-containing protein [Bacteroidota bacterium]